MNTNPQHKIGRRVVIVGGGYGGVAAAKALDADFAVMLIEKNERFFHNPAALRAAVDPDWLSKLFIPYDQLLTNGEIRRALVTSATPRQITTASGETFDFDYLVLATGSSYPLPAKMTSDRVDQASADMRHISARLQAASSILIIGAGPVGIELASEIASAYPRKQVTLTDRQPTLLSGFNPRLAKRITADLNALNIRLVLGETLTSMPSVTNALLNEPLTLQAFTTDKGTQINADLYFLCIGSSLNTAYLQAAMSSVLDDKGRVKVNAHLQVEGQSHIFAIGDITNVPEIKLAALAGFHGALVAENIRRLAHGQQALKAYKPMKPPILVVPVGTQRGAAQLPFGKNGLVLGAWAASRIKGKMLLTDRYWKVLQAKSQD